MSNKRKDPPSRDDAGEEVMTAEDLSKIVNNAIQNQMPRMIIEASKVARENLAQERKLH